MFQKIVIAGRLTRDPQLREFDGDAAVANFGVAVNRTYSDRNGEKVEEVTFFNCSVWGGQARSLHQWKKKGDPVLVEGRMEFKKENEDDPNSRIFSNLRADNVTFLPSGGARSENGMSVTQTQTQAQPEVVPF